MPAAPSHRPGNVVVFRIHEQMSTEDVEQNTRRLELSLAPDVPTHLLLEVDGFRHMDPERLTEIIRFIEPFAPSLSRVAVVGSKTWIKAWIQVGGFPFVEAVAYFDTSESNRAWSWVNEGEG